MNRTRHPVARVMMASESLASTQNGGSLVTSAFVGVDCHRYVSRPELAFHLRLERQPWLRIVHWPQELLNLLLCGLEKFGVKRSSQIELSRGNDLCTIRGIRDIT